jgi:hypothetical protein
VHGGHYRAMPGQHFVVTGTYNTNDVVRVAASDPPALTGNPTGNDVKGTKSDS